MSTYRVAEASTNWQCGKCQQPLSIGRVTVSYMKSHFTVEMFRCPSCGLAYVSQELAQGRMREAEAALEDK